MAAVQLVLVGGERVEVTGTVMDVEKRLQDAARSTAGSLAWLESDGGEPIGVNPEHVVMLRAAE